VGSAAATPAPAASTGTKDSAGSATVSRIAGSNAGVSGGARIARIKAGWHGIADSPISLVFGHGPNSEFRYFHDHPINDNQAQVFDNTYVTVWYDFGLLGLLSLLAAMVGLYWRLRSVPARAIILGTAAQIFFFDVWPWPTAIAVFAVGVALGATGSPELAARPLRELIGNRRRPAAPEASGAQGTGSESRPALAPVARVQSTG
jgi:O-antigen ligase